MKPAKIFIVFIFLSAFAASVSSQDIQFPNELKGFKFYDQGNLKDIKLAVSKLEDWTQVFGKGCLATCDLDGNWEISFFTVGKDSTSTITTGKVERKFMLFPQYADTLWRIVISPKKAISFSEIAFPKTFQKSFGLVSETNYNFDVYKDSEGLSYWIFAEDTKDGKYRKGDLSDIHYTIPHKIESKFHFLIEQKDLAN